MVLTPAVRGLLGLRTDALHHTLTLSPNLPASWSGVRVSNVPLGDTRLDLDLEREKGELVVKATTNTPTVFCLMAEQATEAAECRHAATTEETLNLPLPGVELELPHDLPAPGSPTAQIKVIGEERTPRSLSLTLLGQAGSTDKLRLRVNGAKRVRVSGGTMSAQHLNVAFPAGTGYVEQHVKLEW
jgi:hypothetical protein